YPLDCGVAEHQRLKTRVQGLDPLVGVAHDPRVPTRCHCCQSSADDERPSADNHLFLGRDQEFGPRSIDTGCQRWRPLAANTEGLARDTGHFPLRASKNSSPTRRRRAGSNRAVAEATCAVRITLFIRNSGLLPPGGSCSSTSSPAPAIMPSSSALISAVSSVVGPRPVLT